MKKILIFGGSGLLGSHSSTYFSEKGYEVYSIYNRHVPPIDNIKSIQLDLGQEELVLSLLKEIKPNVILNCSGLTSVEDCESNPQIAKYLHESFPVILAKFTSTIPTINIHISTDHLWDGKKRFYKESDPINPVNTYGKTKGKGEELVLIENPNTLVIRSNFFGKGNKWRKSFSDWVVERLNQSEVFNGYNDIFFTPISIPYLLDYIYKLYSLGFNGVFHVVGSERISKYQFILRFAELLNISSQFVNPTLYADGLSSVPRPMDMSLDTSKVIKHLSIDPPDIEESIRSII